MNLLEQMIKDAEKRNFNKKCRHCEHMALILYEDDTLVARADVGYWQGCCMLSNEQIFSDKRPKNCPLKLNKDIK